MLIHALYTALELNSTDCTRGHSEQTVQTEKEVILTSNLPKKYLVFINWLPDRKTVKICSKLKVLFLNLNSCRLKMLFSA